MSNMTTQEIDYSMKSYPCFIGTLAFDDILPAQYAIQTRLLQNNHASFIYNTKPSYNDGEHWVACYIRRNGTGEFFDSFGSPPPLRLSRLFHKLFKNYQLEYNSDQLQSLSENNCGQHCINFLSGMHII